MNIKSLIKRVAFVAAVAATIQAGSAQASTVTIDFNSAPIGFQTNTYAAQGVTFSGGLLGAGVNVQSFVSGGYSPVFTVAGNQSLFLNTVDVNDHVTHTPSTFATFAFDVSNVSMIFADSEIGSYLGRIIAYNAANVQIGDTGYLTTPGSGYATLSLNVSGIRKLEFYTDWDGAVVDNLVYTVADVVAVPEPATLALLGLGLAGIAGAGKGKRKSKKVAA